MKVLGLINLRFKNLPITTAQSEGRVLVGSEDGHDIQGRKETSFSHCSSGISTISEMYCIIILINYV